MGGKISPQSLSHSLTFSGPQSSYVGRPEVRTRVWDRVDQFLCSSDSINWTRNRSHWNKIFTKHKSLLSHIKLEETGSMSLILTMHHYPFTGKHGREKRSLVLLTMIPRVDLI